MSRNYRKVKSNAKNRKPWTNLKLWNYWKSGSRIEAIIIDPKIYQEEKLILAFGTSRMSMEITAKELKTLLEYCHKTIIMLEEKTGEE